jgi:hypothetical protein
VKISPLLLGLFFIGMGLFSVFTGRSTPPLPGLYVARSSTRDKEPKKFLGSVLAWILIGIGLVIWGVIRLISN